MSPSLKRNGYSGGIVGVNGAKTRTNVISLILAVVITILITTHKWVPIAESLSGLAALSL